MSRQHLPIEVKIAVIEEIRKRPELWDPDHPITNKLVKNLAWEKIAKKLGLPVEKIKSLWMTLKKSYSDLCTGVKPMDMELAHEMQFMCDVVMVSGKRKLSVNSPANQKQTGLKRKNIVQKKIPAQARGQEASFSANGIHIYNNMQYGATSSGAGNHSGFIDGLIRDGERSSFNQNTIKPRVQKKTTVRKTNSKGTPLKSADVKVCSWITGKLLSSDTIVSSNLNEFRNKMVDMLIKFMPGLTSKILEHENRWYELDGIPEDVCIAVWRREMEKLR